MERKIELDILQRARKGDSAAFEEIVRAHEKTVYNLALRTLGNREDAEDAVQETFLKAYMALSGFRGESRLSVWLYRIASNVCTDALRRRRETVSLSAEDENGERELEIEDFRFDPAAVTERRDLCGAVRRALDALPDASRRVLLLREIAGLSYDEIARALEIDVGTVKTRIFRGRKKLCVLLSENENFFRAGASKSSERGDQV